MKANIHSAKRIIFIFTLLLFLSSAFADEDPIVYITKTGKKYHTASCPYLRKSKIPIRLSEAAARGYTPCSKCHPPTLQTIKKSTQTPSSQASIYRVNVYHLKSYKEVDISRCLQAKVIKHVDGDTVYVKIDNPPSRSLSE